LAQEGLLSMLQSKLANRLPDGPPALGNVSLATDPSRMRGRRRAAGDYADVDLVVLESDDGALWLAVDLSLYNAAQLSGSLPLEFNATDLPLGMTHGPVLAVAAIEGSNEPDGGGSGQAAGIAIGVVIAIVCLVLGIVVTKRWHGRRRVMSGLFKEGEVGASGVSRGTEATAVRTRHDVPSESWMRDNPLYRPGGRESEDSGRPAGTGSRVGEEEQKLRSPAPAPPKYYYPSFEENACPESKVSTGSEPLYYSEPRFDGRIEPLDYVSVAARNGATSDGYMIPMATANLPVYSASDRDHTRENDYAVPSRGDLASDLYAAPGGSKAPPSSNTHLAQGRQYLQPVKRLPQRRSGDASLHSEGASASREMELDDDYLNFGDGGAMLQQDDRRKGEGESATPNAVAEIDYIKVAEVQHASASSRGRSAGYLEIGTLCGTDSAVAGRGDGHHAGCNRVVDQVSRGSGGPGDRVDSSNV
jgi:hypothetical protein